jgi:CheY-like chemotaxis protein
MPEDKQIRILVVDDEIISLENISHVLSKEGYHVETASCGKDAVENIAHNNFDLIITTRCRGDHHNRLCNS